MGVRHEAQVRLAMRVIFFSPLFSLCSHAPFSLLTSSPSADCFTVAVKHEPLQPAISHQPHSHQRRRLGHNKKVWNWVKMSILFEFLSMMLILSPLSPQQLPLLSSALSVPPCVFLCAVAVITNDVRGGHSFSPLRMLLALSFAALSFATTAFAQTATAAAAKVKSLNKVCGA